LLRGGNAFSARENVDFTSAQSLFQRRGRLNLLQAHCVNIQKNNLNRFADNKKELLK
jgi:hypothetical protein